MIEIQRKKSRFQYRQNPYNSRVIDKRLNIANGRWKPYGVFETEQEARAMLLKLESGKAETL